MKFNVHDSRSSKRRAGWPREDTRPEWSLAVVWSMSNVGQSVQPPQPTTATVTQSDLIDF